MLVGGNSSVRMIKEFSSWHTGQGMGAVILSRRDLRTQPGVLTSGKGQKTARPKGAVEMASKFRGSKHGFLTTPCRPFGAGPFGLCNPGLKPRAEALCPFGASIFGSSGLSSMVKYIGFFALDAQPEPVKREVQNRGGIKR
jgi:hypothetical protein